MNSILLLSRDLFFSSKVTGATTAISVPVEVVSSADAAVDRANAGGVGCLLLDLSDNSLNIADILSRLPKENRPRVIAFGPHVATGRLDDARTAGCDEVLTRGQFSASLPELLRQFAHPPV